VHKIKLKLDQILQHLPDAKTT